MKKLKNLCFAVLAAYAFIGINTAHAAQATEEAKAIEVEHMAMTTVDDPLAIPDTVKQILRNMFNAEGFIVYLKQLRDSDSDSGPNIAACSLGDKVSLLGINTVAQRLFSRNPFIIAVQNDKEFNYLECANERLHLDPNWPGDEELVPNFKISFTLEELYAVVLHEIGHITSEQASFSIIEIEMMQNRSMEMPSFPQLSAITHNQRDMRTWKKLATPYTGAPKERAINALSRMHEREADYFVLKSKSSEIIQAYIQGLEKMHVLEGFCTKFRSLASSWVMSLDGETHPPLEERIAYCKEALEKLHPAAALGAAANILNDIK